MSDTRAYICADIIIEFEDESIALAKRGSDPFKGQWALPGGKMDGDETIEETAIREAKEETGIDVELVKIIGVYSDPERDPRGRYVSVVFLAKPVGGMLEAGSDATELLRTKQPDKISLAFDHDQVIRDYLQQKK
jgi:8-oxo-dGTP diphosphatase